MFSNIFGKEEKEEKEEKKAYKVIQTFKMLNDSNAKFYNWNGKLYDSNLIRTAIGTNALHTGKLNPKHIRQKEKEIEVSPNINISRLLKRPNKYMSMYDFEYKMRVQLEINNNAFAFIDRDSNIPGMTGIKGIYPLNANTVECLEDEEETLYLKFVFKNGLYKIVPYSDIIHLRKHFNENDFWGESNKKTLSTPLDTITTTSQGIKNAIKNTAFIRGIIEFAQVLQQEDVDKNVQEFSERYLDINNNNKGLAYTDPRYKFHETKAEPFVPNEKQMDYSKKEIYEYFNTNESIITGKYTEQDWISYYETTIEPFGIQSSLEWTEKIFTSTEKHYGNAIIFEANRLANASNQTKITICKYLKHLFTINEQREFWNMGPIPGGDKRLQTLNDINAEKADEYQLGKKEEEKENE